MFISWTIDTHSIFIKANSKIFIAYKSKIITFESMLMIICPTNHIFHWSKHIS